MELDSPNVTSFLQSLQKLCEDKRLARVSGMAGSGACKYRMPKLSLYDDGKVIFDVIMELCKGRTLNDACDEIGISHPKDFYGQLRLAESSEEMAKSFAVRPTVFLETRSAIENMIEQLRPAASPVSDVPAFAGSLVKLNKLSLWTKDGKEVLEQAEDLAGKCLSHLTAETGLDFRGADSKRLGNIEWLSIPAADEYENTYIAFETVKKEREVTTRRAISGDNCNIKTELSARGVEVKIMPGGLPSGTQALVRCRLRNDNEVILDQCKTARFTEKPVSVYFEAGEEISQVLVTIWVREHEEEQWEIWYEHSIPILRQIHLAIGMVGLQGTLKSDWLKDLYNSRVNDRVKRIQAIEQVHYQHSAIGEYKFDPWVLASRQARNLAQQIFPRPSGGYFFSKGWDSKGPGLLNFIEWFQSLTNNSTASRLLLVDPFFDVAGVELLSRAKATQIEYVVLTNTQVKSTDDLSELQAEKDKDQEVDEFESQRAKRLREACKQVELILSRLKFRLLDLRSVGGGRQQLFHDRYILIFNETGEIRTGYHLSNSIQGATKKAPLLVTPIPVDLLEGVKSYVAELIAAKPPTVDSAKIVELFPIKDKDDIPLSCTNRSGLAAIPYAGHFFAALLEEDILSSLEESELDDYLRNCGLFTQEDGIPVIADRFYAQLDSFTQVLQISDHTNFAKLWTAFGELLAHTPDPRKYLCKVMGAGGEALVIQLKTFLSKAPELNSPLGSLGTTVNTEATGLLNLFKQDFQVALRNARYLLENGIRFCLPGYGIRYGAKLLTWMNPEKLAVAISEVWNTLSWEHDNDPKSQAIAHTFTLIMEAIWEELISVKDDKLLFALLKSDVPLLRAIAAQSLMISSPSGEAKLELQTAFRVLQILNDPERTHTLAEWVFGIRVEANQENMENTRPKELRLAIFDEIRRTWPAKLPQEELRAIVGRLSGPGEGRWAVSINNELLVPLIEENKLTVDDVAQLWLTILIERLGERVCAASPKQESRHLNFYAETDQELTDVCGWILANLAPESRQPWLERLEEVEKKGGWVLQQPFARSRDYSGWNNARKSLLWLQTLIKLARHYGINGEMGEPDVEKLEQLDKRLEEILVNVFREDQLQWREPLLTFASCVKQCIKEQPTKGVK